MNMLMEIENGLDCCRILSCYKLVYDKKVILMNVDPNLTKYLIKAKISTDGVVEKPDVVGAIFGQTEGLLGDELDLRDLQKGGKIWIYIHQYHLFCRILIYNRIESGNNLFHFHPVGVYRL